MKPENCPNCGTKLDYDSDDDMWYCPTCDEWFTLDELQEDISN